MSRQGLDPIAQAKGIKQLIEVFNYTHEAVALVLGKARSSVTNLLRLLTLDARIQQWIEQGALNEAQGKALAGLKLADNIVGPIGASIASGVIDNLRKLYKPTNKVKQKIPLSR